MKKLLVYLIVGITFLACSKEKPEVSKEVTPVNKEKATTCNGSATVGNDWYMNYVTSGTQCIWYNSSSNFGLNAASGTGFAAMIVGCHWGHCSGDKQLPRKLNGLNTWFTQTVNSSNGYDACYDIWFDASSNPTGRNATYEMMIWLQWKNTQPIAGSYNAQGQAVPYAKNVSLGGYTWNVYYRPNTFSFLLTSQRSSISLNAKALSDYAYARGWLPGGLYCTSCQAGWENTGKGTYTATSYGVSAW